MNVIDPVTLSLEENQFLLDHVGEPPMVALRSLPQAGVNAAAVEPVLTTVYTLEQLREHKGEEWAGVDAVKATFQRYLAEAEKWKNDKRRGRPRFPTMWIFDAKGRPHRGGPGSDSGQVRTYFNAKGEREVLALDLSGVKEDAYVPPTQADMPKTGIVVDGERNRIECTVCGKCESFNPNSQASYNAARARISKHLRTATDKSEEHREIYTLEFGSTNA